MDCFKGDDRALKRVGAIVWRRRDVTFHGSKISESKQTVVLKYGKKRRKQLTCMTFPCMIALRNKTVTHNFLPSFDNENNRLFKKDC